jgi:guanylate kinase
MSDEDVIKKSFVDIFIAPPSMEELRRRLCGRSTDSAEVIEKRMLNAREEMQQQSCYQHIVVNDVFEKAVDDLLKIIEREHHNR